MFYKQTKKPAIVHNNTNGIKDFNKSYNGNIKQKLTRNYSTHGGRINIQPHNIKPHFLNACEFFEKMRQA